MIALPSAAATKKKAKKVPARLDLLPLDEEGGPADDEALLDGTSVCPWLSSVPGPVHSFDVR